MFGHVNNAVGRICALLWLTISAATIHAQDASDSLRYLDEVVVTAQRTPKEIIPVQQLAGKELSRLSAHNVADALRYFSGIQIKDYGGVGGLKTVNIRSMGTNHVGVFYDGIELGNAQNGTVDLGRFSLDNMESITLYNGQKSAIFQPAKDFGSAGSIYLQSKTPYFDHGESRHVKATFKTGSFGLANPALLWEQKVTEKVSTSVSGEYMYTTGRYKYTYKVEDSYDTTAVRHNGDVNAIRLENGWYGQMKDGYWKAKGYLYRSARGYPGAVVRNKFTHEDRQWDTNVFAQGSIRRNIGTRYSLMANAKYAYDYLHYLADPQRDEALMYTDNRYHQHETYVSVANRLTVFPWWDVSLSADYQFNLLDADLKDFAYPRRHTLLVAAATAFQWERVKLQASLLGTFVNDRTKKGRSAESNTQWTPTAIFSYRPLRKTDLNLRAFYKRIFRMPTLNDLYYTFIGNADLKPEYTNQYDIGATYTKNFNGKWLKRLEIQTDVYYNEVQNKIIATPTSNFFRWTMTNLGEVEIRGVDAAIQTDWNPAGNLLLTTRLNYTYQKAQDVTNPDDAYYGGQIPYIPWHSGSAIVGLVFGPWEANYSFIYTGERYASQANTPENYQLPWYTSDLSLTRNLVIGQGEARITLEVNNLLNQQYEVVACYPMPGINFKAILQYTF